MSAPNARRSPSVIDSAETKRGAVKELLNVIAFCGGVSLLSDFPHENSVLCVLSTNGPKEKS